MKPMISRKRMFDAFLCGGLGTEETFYLWTPIWAIRSRIWRKGALKKQARKSLGEMTRSAIEEGNSELFKQIGAALEWMVDFERSPEKTRTADIYYAIEELNETRPKFTTGDVLAILNSDLGATVTPRELEAELERLNLNRKIPRPGKGRARRPGAMGKQFSGNQLAEVKNSGIHQSGLFARRDIKKGKRVIEYIGDRVIRSESERRATEQLEVAAKTGEGGVYIFTVNARYDIDGTKTANIARFANHSCAPNCETDVVEDRVWIMALKDIKKGDELVYNYNFDLECYEEHPCRCGSANCVGYIVAKQYWPKLRKLLAKKEKKKTQSAGKKT